MSDKPHSVNPETGRCVMCSRNAFQLKYFPWCDFIPTSAPIVSPDLTPEEVAALQARIEELEAERDEWDRKEDSWKYAAIKWQHEAQDAKRDLREMARALAEGSFFEVRKAFIKSEAIIKTSKEKL